MRTMGREIANSELIESDLPPADADEEMIWQFARTFDGYRFIESQERPNHPAADNLVWRLGYYANPARGAFFKEGTVPITMSELRACLFFEWRREHHQGTSPDGPMMQYLHALIAAIREKVRAGETT
jgi:hypothetical protein